MMSHLVKLVKLAGDVGSNEEKERSLETLTSTYDSIMRYAIELPFIDPVSDQQREQLEQGCRSVPASDTQHPSSYIGGFFISAHKC
jgi:hypothetical protein